MLGTEIRSSSTIVVDLVAVAGDLTSVRHSHHDWIAVKQKSTLIQKNNKVALSQPDINSV